MNNITTNNNLMVLINILLPIKFHNNFKDFPNIEYSRMKEEVLYRFRYRDGMPFKGISCNYFCAFAC